MAFSARLQQTAGGDPTKKLTAADSGAGAGHSSCFFDDWFDSLRAKLGIVFILILCF